MASTDSLEDVTAFAKLNEANFPVLSDESGSVATSYGVITDAGYARRWTYYLDINGNILHVDKNVNTATAGPDLAANLDRLGYRKK